MRVQDMKPGPRMNALVAEHVMGWKFEHYSPDWSKWWCRELGDGHGWWLPSGGKEWICGPCHGLPEDYSTDIAATCNVLAAMEPISCDWTIEKAGQLYHVAFGAVGHSGTGLLSTICIAALLAVGVTEVDP